MKEKHTDVRVPESGEVFGVPQSNGLLRVIQAVRSWTVGATLWIMCDDVIDNGSPNIPHPLHPIACFTATYDAAGITRRWPLLGERPLIWSAASEMADRLSAIRLIGVMTVNSLIVRDFADACAGLTPWNRYHDPKYFDKLLIPGVKRPAAAYEISKVNPS